METAIYYTMSTIAQTLAAAVALLAVFLVFLFQSYRNPMQGRLDELHSMSGMFDAEADREKVELLWKMESFDGVAGLFASVQWPPPKWGHIEKPLRVLQGHVALRRLLSHRFRVAAISCSGLIVASVATIPLAPWLSLQACLAAVILAVGVLAFASCILLCYRVVELALDKRPTSTAADA